MDTAENIETKPIVTLDNIWSQLKNSGNIIRKLPHYVMLHPCNMKSLREEAYKSAEDCSSFLYSQEPIIFGMKVIWTTDIGENDIICTYKVLDWS